MFEKKIKIIKSIMDWFSFFVINLWPSLIINIENLFFQFFLIYFMYVIFTSINVYFNLFYLFIMFFLIGIFIALYNLELFTAFLWLTECVVVFISILFLFYLNIHGNSNKLNIIVYSLKNYGLYIGFLLLTFFFIFLYESEFFIPIELNFNYLWDDFYEALWNTKLNDLTGLYISYYHLNSFEFVLIGYLLLIGSVVCVNLNKLNRNIKANNYYELFILFDFFNDFVKFFFMRKQNLVDQGVKNASTRNFKKKVSK